MAKEQEPRTRERVLQAVGTDVLHTVDTGVQPFDCLFRSGAAHQWMPARFPQRLGNEFAVDAPGDGHSTASIGDEGIGWAAWPSTYAEHVVVHAGQFVAKPAGMPWAQAGVLSASGRPRRPHWPSWDRYGPALVGPAPSAR